LKLKCGKRIIRRFIKFPLNPSGAFILQQEVALPYYFKEENRTQQRMRRNRHGSFRTILNLSNNPPLSVFFITIIYLLVVATAFSETKPKASPSLHVTLQSCFTPESILKNVAVVLAPGTESSRILSSLVLVRISKQLISLDNKRNNHQRNDSSTEDFILHERDDKLWEKGLKNAITCMIEPDWAESPKSLESVVEGIKGASVISRLLPKYQKKGGDMGVIDESIYPWWEPLFEQIVKEDKMLAAIAQPHQLSGLKWSIDCFQLSATSTDFLYKLPQNLQQAYNVLDLPFIIRPGFLTQASTSSKISCADDQGSESNLFTVESFIDQVDFRTEKIQTMSNRAVIERRQTAWMGDDDVHAFEYSGKSMKRMPWATLVANVRDRLCDDTSNYYDGCLVNLYPDGGSGMRYHIDPGQGVQWGFETAVVSIGATRRFAFRPINGVSDCGEEKPHSFVLMNGDVTEMVRDCQDRFQHSVKTAEFKNETAPRISLVFKKTFKSSR